MGLCCFYSKCLILLVWNAISKGEESWRGTEDLISPHILCTSGKEGALIRSAWQCSALIEGRSHLLTVFYSSKNQATCPQTVILVLKSETLYIGALYV